ncbi:MAG: hypothetical protein E8A46_08160 [Bradyrhizobium sp.]|jgi:hypothetical protein|uniref:hypothetical protein n=1 Tax=Bradyrhizobium sp. TaxID=376 RepID=UPI001229B3D2|nr:hypothetical protein [Bradyrhizobium sp.]THD54559.1 MAG: hypothetical protein E8A46_08160 [Bradyrhizobium sp.]
MPSLKVDLASIIRSDNLRAEERAFLERWLSHPFADQVWSKIEVAMQSNHGEAADGLRRTFIHEMLAALTGHAADSATFRKQADKAESLARFLRGPDLRPHPPLLPNSEALISSLEDAAVALRTMATNQINAGLKQVSRMDINGSKRRVIFMWSVSDLLVAFCGKFLDEAGIFLTDVAFPSQQTTLDQMRAARRPTTKASRGKSAE